MNKVERVRAALSGAAVDRVPAGFWFHFPPQQATGDASVRAHLDYYRASGVDYLKVMNEHPYDAGVTISNPADWRKLRPAPLATSRFYREQLDELKAIVDAIGGECLVISTVFNPFAAANHTSGNLVTEHMRADPEATNEGLAAIAQSLAWFADACIEAGASGIYFSAQGGEHDRFDGETFDRYIRPHDLTVLDVVRNRGEFNLLHLCRDRIRLEAYADYPAHAVNWAVTKHDLTMSQARGLFRRTLVGGMDDRGVIVSGPEPAIREAVHRVIDEAGTRSFILGADCTLPTDVPIAHIRTAVEATADYATRSAQ